MKKNIGRPKTKTANTRLGLTVEASTKSTLARVAKQHRMSVSALLDLIADRLNSSVAAELSDEGAADILRGIVAPPAGTPGKPKRGR